MRKRIILILGMMTIGLTACSGNDTVSNSNTVEAMKNIEMENSEVEETSRDVEESDSDADNGDIPTEQQDNEPSLKDNVSADVQGQDTAAGIDANDGEDIVPEKESEIIPTGAQQTEQSEAATDQPKAEQAKQEAAEQPKAEQTQQEVVEQPKAEQPQEVVEQPKAEQPQEVVEQPKAEQPQEVVEQPSYIDTDPSGFDGINPATGEKWKEGDVMPSGAIFWGDPSDWINEKYGF